MNTFVWNKRAVLHLRNGNTSSGVLILLRTVFQLRKAKARLQQQQQVLTRNIDYDTTNSAQKQDQSNNPAIASMSTSTSTSASTSSTSTCASARESFLTSVPISNLSNQHRVGGSTTASVVPEAADPATSVNAASSSSTTTTTTTGIRLFDHAFVTCSPHPQEGSHFRPLAYAMLLYNAGLALHIRGLETDDQDHVPKQHHNERSSSASLHLAAKFYTSALEVLERNCHDGTPGEITLLLLAVFNNLGHIQSHFFDVTETLKSVEWLRALTEAKSSTLLPEWWGQELFFRLNVAFIPPGSVFSLAPAA
ncbi:expressed unknown protein [Seminavis robusta]|uniref:Uncharacterized protein n=1 Tax=Seminavis robusta TaxID=568900 RepID=A0A9N8H4Y0_9STRA|nr:expressed unknown protein [Seminavis robusta]|eukprot:Sro60_g034880.1 n/a (308) ;mRNA; f:138878-139801